MKALITIETPKQAPKWWRSLPLTMLIVMSMLAWIGHLEMLVIVSFLCAFLLCIGISILRWIWSKD